MNIKNFSVKVVNGELHFTTSQVAQILGQTQEWVSRNCLEGKRFPNSYKDGKMYYIPEGDVLGNIDKMDRSSEEYEGHLMERTLVAVHKYTEFKINSALEHPQWYSKDYIKGYKQATRDTLRLIRKYYGENAFAELVGGLEE